MQGYDGNRAYNGNAPGNGAKYERIFVSQGSLTELDPEAFLDLVSQCGLKLKELDLAKLARQKLVEPWQRDEENSYYTELHLFLVAHYLEAVSPVQHSWGKESSEISVEGVRELGQQLNHILDTAAADSVGDLDRKIREFMMELERFLARIDPFGPLGDIFDLLRPQIRKEIKNSGRLYLELRRAATQVALRLEGEAGEDSPMTQPMFIVESTAMLSDKDLRSTQVIDESVGETSAAAKQAIDEVLSAASEASDASEEKPPRSSRPPREMAKVPPTPTEEEDQRDTDILKASEVEDKAVGLHEESSEPIVLLEEEISEAELPAAEIVEEQEFSRDVPTQRTKDLANRLKSLRKQDGRKEEPPTTPQAKAIPDIAKRIADLNKRREVYLKNQEWQKLADLYEDGMELFSEPAERQQVYLVLAMLYEVKLRKKDRAFSAFANAWGEREAAAGQAKALEGLQRLGRASSLQQRYVEWLQEQLELELATEDAARLQKELALALFADQKYDASFSGYAAFLKEAPEEAITTDSLTQLQRLGEHVETSQMDSFLKSILELKLKDETREVVEEFMEATTD